MPAHEMLFFENCQRLLCRAGSQRRVRREHPSRQVAVRARWRHQRGLRPNELQRAHHQVRGLVAPWCLELEFRLPGGVELYPAGDEASCRLLLPSGYQ